MAGSLSGPLLTWICYYSDIGNLVPDQNGVLCLSMNWSLPFISLPQGGRWNTGEMWENGHPFLVQSGDWIGLIFKQLPYSISSSWGGQGKEESRGAWFCHGIQGPLWYDSNFLTTTSFISHKMTLPAPHRPCPFTPHCHCTHTHPLNAPRLLLKCWMITDLFLEIAHVSHPSGNLNWFISSGLMRLPSGFPKSVFITFYRHGSFSCKCLSSA